MIHLVLAGLISIVLSPGVCQAPCDVSVTLKVEPAPDNDKVIIEVEGDRYSSTSFLDFSNGGPKTQQIWYKSLPAGVYEIKVSLHKHDGKSWVAATDSKTIEVTGN